MSMAPLPKPLSAVHKNDGPVMILAFSDGSTGFWAIGVTSEGAVRHMALNDLSVDWRYDFVTNRWVDVSFAQPDLEEEDDGDTETEKADHGGEAVP